MTLKVATVQLPAKEFGLKTIENYLHIADSEHVDIICFPEGYLNGYTRDEIRARNIAIDLLSNQFHTIIEKLQKFQTTAIVGMIEIEHGTLFNTAVILQHGKVLGKYRKIHPQEGIFKAGSQCPVFDVRGGKFGVNICYDANFPETAHALAKQGAKIIFYPLNNELKNESAIKWRHKHLINLTKRAQETTAWIVSSDVVIESKKTIGYGCTAIVTPTGEVAAKIAEFQQGMATYEIHC